MPCVAWVTGSVENIPRAAVDLSLIVRSRMRHGTRTGYRRTTINQMFMPTYLSSNVFAPLEICILTSTNHGGQVARLPVSYASSPSFCHSSHVVVYFIL